MDALRSLVQPLVGGGAGNGVIDGMKLVVLGTTVETARRMASSGWSHFINSFFLTAHFVEDDYPYDWLMLWLSRRPEWQRSREFETTTRTASRSHVEDNSFADPEEDDALDDGRAKTRVVFQPTFDTTHTIFYRGHWLRVRRSRNSNYSEVLSISVVARNNSILKQLVLQAKREYEAEAVQRVQIYFADAHGSWRWTDSRHKRPISSIVLNPGVKEMLLNDTKDFLCSEKWYADRGIPFRRGYLLHGVPGSGKSSLIHAIAGALTLDIYVVSLSASWINDATLTTLMGRVPARCIVLLEDLDAAFTRSTSREEEKGRDKVEGPDNKDSNNTSSSKRKKDQLSDVNTLSLSGLLNALDGVAAAEGRLLFATTNHLEKLDPALSRPGRMDVWIEFRNASKWQAEQLFRNFFPSSEPRDDEIDLPEGEALDRELGDVKLRTEMAPVKVDQASGEILPATPRSRAQSSASSVLAPSGESTSSLSSLPTTLTTATTSATASSTNVDATAASSVLDLPGEAPASKSRRVKSEDEHAIQHASPPLSNGRLAQLARKFADSIPDEEFSVAALQGYLLKNKTRPEAAADEAAAWVVSERDMKAKLKKEKEEKEARTKAEREERRKLREEEARKKAEEDKNKPEEDKTNSTNTSKDDDKAEKKDGDDSEKKDDESSEESDSEEENKAVVVKSSWGAPPSDGWA